MSHIFITVGNGKFEPLVKEVDRLKGEGKITEDVVIQLGHGSYKPQHCEWFDFVSPLDQYYNKVKGSEKKIEETWWDVAYNTHNKEKPIRNSTR